MPPRLTSVPKLVVKFKVISIKIFAFCLPEAVIDRLTIILRCSGLQEAAPFGGLTFSDLELIM